MSDIAFSIDNIDSTGKIFLAIPVTKIIFLNVQLRKSSLCNGQPVARVVYKEQHL